MNILSKQEKIAVSAAVVGAVILFFGGQIWNTFFSPKPEATQQTTTKEPQTITMKNISTIQGMEIYDEQVGTGAVAKAGQMVTAHYIGYLTNGTKFDSSLDKNQPFTFKLGAGDVIKGWDQGIAGMKVGGVRRLVIAPELAYGAKGKGPIPANATLIFEVELLGVK